MALVATITYSGLDAVVALNGAIDEAATPELMKLLSIRNGATVVDLSGITSINSIGIRSWITFMQGFRATHAVRLRGCSPDVVAQINMIPTFAGDARVESFFAPYYCEACDKGFRLEFPGNESYEALLPKVESAPCPRCQASCECEELADEFLSFLAHR